LLEYAELLVKVIFVCLVGCFGCLLVAFVIIKSI
jgi:hypothetical protein